MDAESSSLHIALMTLLLAGETLSFWTVAGEFLLLLIFLLASAFFSGSEVALFSLDEKDLETLQLDSTPQASYVLRLLENQEFLLISILVLNTLANVAAAILAALITMQIATLFHWPTWAVMVTEIFVLTFTLLIISEITPKMIAIKNPITFSKRIAHPLLMMIKVISPLSRALTWFTKESHKLIQYIFKPKKQLISSEEIKLMVDMVTEAGQLPEEERERIYSIIELSKHTVREIMVSRMDIIAIPHTASLSEAIALIQETKHSRYPLYKEHLDNILGIIYAKDLLEYLTMPNPPEHISWEKIKKPAMFVPDSMKLSTLLREFQKKRMHIAIVVDEYGGTEGLVTLEDVLEEIIGEIQEEYEQTEQELYEVVDDRTLRFDARINLDEVKEVLRERWGIDVEKQVKTLEPSRYDFETLGGWIYHMAKNVPKQGDKFRADILELEVESTQGKRIGTILVRLQDNPASPVAKPEEALKNDGHTA